MNPFADTSAECPPPSLDVIGPGWYDSSRDLLHGLEVHEGLPADADLGEWIRAWFPAAAPHRRAPARRTAMPGRAPNAGARCAP